MTLADHTLFYKSNPNVHVIVTYSEQKKLDELVFTFLNEGLKRGQLCVYATVNMDYTTMEKLSSKIMDFETNVKNDNFLLVNLKPHIQSLLKRDLTPFEKLKKSILFKLLKRNDKHVRLYGDLVSYLFENNHFDESILLEDWWQNSSFEGTKICPYQNSILQDSPLEQKEKLMNSHDKIVLC